jgi:hypothetical protein
MSATPRPVLAHLDRYHAGNPRPQCRPICICVEARYAAIQPLRRAHLVLIGFEDAEYETVLEQIADTDTVEYVASLEICARTVLNIGQDGLASPLGYGQV